jgi:hypothetical protein
MNKKLKIALIISGILIVLVFLSFTGFYNLLNSPLNRLIAGTPDKDCNADRDCALKDTNCQACDCGDAVNKDWNKFCPFPNFEMVYCKMCASLGYDFEIKCVNNRCQKVSINRLN